MGPHAANWPRVLVKIYSTLSDQMSHKLAQLAMNLRLCLNLYEFVSSVFKPFSLFIQKLIRTDNKPLHEQMCHLFISFCNDNEENLIWSVCVRWSKRQNDMNNKYPTLETKNQHEKAFIMYFTMTPLIVSNSEWKQAPLEAGLGKELLFSSSPPVSKCLKLLLL